jgi:hypothetical protein
MVMQPETLSKAIQLSVAPVFLLAGIGALLNVISTRLARIVDAAKRAKEGVLAGNPIDEQERRCYRRRMQLTIRAIELLTGSTLLIAAVVAVMFFSVISRLNLTVVVAPLFISAMTLLMLASLCFLREVQLASRRLHQLI